MRHQHILKHNQQNELPQHMIFVDTEASINEDDKGIQHHTLKLGFAVYVRRRRVDGVDTYTETPHRFTHVAGFWDFVESCSYSGSKLYVFAHNWNYDAGILSTATELANRGWECKRYVNEKPPFILHLQRERHYLVLLDTLNYFAQALASIGQSIGLSKGEMPDQDAPEEDWWRYNERDTHIIKELMQTYIAYVRDNDLGNFQPTLASQAFNGFRHRFLTTPIYIHDRKSVCELEREGYHGGRSEAFYLGKLRQPLYYLDVNSLYPSVMADHEYPVKLVGNSRHFTPEDTRQLLVDYHVVARVRVTTNEPIYPLRMNGKLVFPIGTFWTTLNTPELAYAFERGHISTVPFVAWYEHAPIFRRFVEEMYALRRRFAEEGNAKYAYVTKFVLNSLYGKFGQNGMQWRETGEHVDDYRDTWLYQETPSSPVRKFRVRMGEVQEYHREGETDNSFPAIAGHVTAYGRMKMWAMMQQIGRDHVYYMDTDSLIVDAHGFARANPFLDAQQLGKLKLEKQTNEAVFYGVKDYIFGDAVHRKGVRAKARQLSTNQFEQDHFVSWDLLLSRGIEGEIQVYTERKTLSRKYDKGIRTASGWVAPLIV